MTPRIFISYRTSDGADKATALARELNALFGNEQVFLDKEDLPAGRPWREASGAAFDDQPILLLLITPQVVGPRRFSVDDPVRQEVAAALGLEAHVIPLLCDGVERLPEAQAWPPEMRPLAERTWRRLRAYDWRADVDRHVGDLAWTGFATQWSERFDSKLDQVVWRGVGRALRDPGPMTSFAVKLRVETPTGSEPIETGSLFAELSADGRRMTGRLWTNGEQAARSLEMARGAAAD